MDYNYKRAVRYDGKEHRNSSLMEIPDVSCAELDPAAGYGYMKESERIQNHLKEGKLIRKKMKAFKNKRKHCAFCAVLKEMQVNAACKNR